MDSNLSVDAALVGLGHANSNSRPGFGYPRSAAGHRGTGRDSDIARTGPDEYQGGHRLTAAPSDRDAGVRDGDPDAASSALA